MKTNKIIFTGILLIVGLALATAQSPVISPVEGVWANYQSLVLDLPEGSDAYYSFTGDDPSISGFAYDGPVLIEIDGNVEVRLLITSQNGDIESYTINYTIDLQPIPPYMVTKKNQPLIEISDSQFIDIPQTTQYSLGTKAPPSFGKRLSISGNVFLERIIALTLYDGFIPFRYILQIGQAPIKIAKKQFLPKTKQIDSIPIEEISSSVENILEFTDWDYFTFRDNDPITYSINDGALLQKDSQKIFLDRKKANTLRWKSDDTTEGTEFETLLIPPRPEVIGIPQSPIVNEAVYLSLSDENYVFAWENASNEIIFTPTITIDALPGDAFGFSKNIDIYYKEIKQGSIMPVFIIDKIVPETPNITSSDTSGYSRKAVTLTFEGEGSLFYYIPPPLSSKEGFTVTQYANSSIPPNIRKEQFTQLVGNTLLLNYGNDEALLYKVYVYSSDFAGNTSDIVSYQTVVDPFNYYLIQNPTEKSYVPTGTKDAPFTNFIELYQALNIIDGQRFYIDGVFTYIPTLTITRKTSIIGTGDTRLIFAKDALIQVTDTTFSMLGCTLEQNLYNENDIFQTSLIQAKNSTLNFEDCELVLYAGNTGSSLNLDTSSAKIMNSGITVQATVYGVGIIANSSTVTLINLRSVIIAETAVGMSFAESSFLSIGSSFTMLGRFARASEFVRSFYSLTNNLFIFEPIQSAMENTAKNTVSAVWADSYSKEVTNVGNSYKGFSAPLTGL